MPQVQPAVADADSSVTTGMATKPSPDDAPFGRPVAAVIAVLTTLLGVIVLAWAILFVTKGRFLKAPFEHIVGGATHRQVTVSGDFQLYFDPFDLKFLADGLSIANPAWATKPYLFRSDHIDTRIAPLSLVFGRQHLRWLNLVNGAADLEWNAAHTTNSWTFAASKKGGKPLTLPLVDRATVTGTTLRYRDPRMQLLADLGFDTVRSQQTHVGGAVRFAGTGTFRGQPARIAGALLSPNATIAGGRNALRLVVDAAHNHITVAGTLPGLTDVEKVPLQTTASGRNIAELLNIIGVAVPATRAYALKAQMVKDGDTYSFTKLSGHFGDSDLAGRFSVANVKPRLKLTADLVSRQLDIVDLAPFIGYDPQAVAAKGKAAAVAHVGGHPRVLPDATLRVDALKNFDADVTYKVRTIKGRNIPVSNVALSLGLDDSLLKLDPLTFDMARGHVTAHIGIDARRAPVFTTYDIHLSPTPMGVLLAGYGVDQSGTSGTVEARINMTGRGDTVHESLANSNGRIAIILPRGTFWTRNVQLAEIDLGTFVQKMFQHKLKQPVEINCGLIGFTVRNGIAAADPILIDTSKNVIVGRGGFSFKDEAIDLRVRADAKTFSLFSGQSPVGLEGYFGAPKIDVISPQLLARAGAAIGLGIVATPFAAILAFVDPGNAKATACGPVLAGANANAQRTVKGRPRDDVGHGTTAKDEDGKQSKSAARKQHKKFLGIF